MNNQTEAAGMAEERSRYEHSLLELCGRIHSAFTGSGDGIPWDEVDRLYHWLLWRINEGWEPSHGLGSWSFDNAVRALCLVALRELTLCAEEDLPRSPGAVQ